MLFLFSILLFSLLCLLFPPFLSLNDILSVTPDPDKYPYTVDHTHTSFTTIKPASDSGTDKITQPGASSKPPSSPSRKNTCLTDCSDHESVTTLQIICSCDHGYDCKRHHIEGDLIQQEIDPSMSEDSSSNYYAQIYDLPTDYVKVAPKYFSICDYYDTVMAENDTEYDYHATSHGTSTRVHGRSAASYEHLYHNFSQNASGPLPPIPNYPSGQKIARFASRLTHAAAADGISNQMSSGLLSPLRQTVTYADTNKTAAGITVYGCY